MLALAIFPGTGYASLIDTQPRRSTVTVATLARQAQCAAPGCTEIYQPTFLALPNGVRPYLHHAFHRLYALQELEQDLYRAAMCALVARLVQPVAP